MLWQISVVEIVQTCLGNAKAADSVATLGSLCPNGGLDWSFSLCPGLASKFWGVEAPEDVPAPRGLTNSWVVEA